MMKRQLDKKASGHFEDFRGNNIAFNCPVCDKVFIVSGLSDKKGRECPNCGKSRGFVDERGENASIEYDDETKVDPGKLVFFIGAGFTKAIADTAPTGNDFLVKAFGPDWDFSDGHRVRDLKNFLVSVYHPLQDEASYPRVEDVLSLLDYCISAGRPLNKEFDLESLARLRGTLVYIISHMIRESFRRHGRQELARKFVHKAHKLARQLVVISTNYDIVLDNALLSEAKSCNYGIRLRKSVGLPGKPNQRASADPSYDEHWHYHDEFTTKETDGKLNKGGILHLKLHGSLNWVYCPKCDEIDITIAGRGRPICCRTTTTRSA